MNNNTIDFGAGWSPSNAAAPIKQRSANRVSFADKFEDALAHKNYEQVKELVKDPQLKKSKQKGIAKSAVITNFDADLFEITQKTLELRLNHIFHAIRHNPSLVFDDAVATLIEKEKSIKSNAWCWDPEKSVYIEIYDEFMGQYMQGNHTRLPVLQKIQSIDPFVLNDVGDLSEVLFAPMSPTTTQFLLELPSKSWNNTVEIFDEKTMSITSEDLLKVQKSLQCFPQLHTAFQNFYTNNEKKHQIFLDFFNENIGFDSQKECVLQDKIKDKTLKIESQYGVCKSLNALCERVLPYKNSITKLGLSEPQTFLYNDYESYHELTWIEGDTKTPAILKPSHPNFLSEMIGRGAPALELAFQTQQGIAAVEECLKDDYTRAMFAMNASIPIIKTALACIPSLRDFKDQFENGMDHFMALRKDQNKQVVECVAQHFSNSPNVFGKTFGGVYEYIQSPAKANEYQKLLLKNVVKKDDDVLKKMRSRSATKRKM